MAVLMKIRQTPVDLPLKISQLVLTLTPQPEAHKDSHSVAPSSASSGSGGPARKIQRRLGYQFVASNRAPSTDGNDLPAIPEFGWADFRVEDGPAAGNPWSTSCLSFAS